MKRDLFFVWVIVVIVLFLLIALLTLCVADLSNRRRCEDNGGTVENYDCQTVEISTSCGSGCTTEISMESCNWRCVGSTAEAR